MSGDRQIERLVRTVYGDPNNGVGLRQAVSDLQLWQKKIDMERRTIKALGVGILFGLGLNGAGILAILRVLGW